MLEIEMYFVSEAGFATDREIQQENLEKEVMN